VIIAGTIGEVFDARPCARLQKTSADDLRVNLTRAHRVQGVGRKNANADQCEERDYDIHDATLLLATA
jgi:hypothetical protein